MDAIRIPHMMQQVEALLEMNRHRDALALLGRVLAEHPHHHGALCQLSRAQLGLGEHRKALEAAQQAVAADPDNEWGYRLGAIVLNGLKQHRQAVRMAEECVRCAPQLPNALYTLAQSLLHVREYDRARTMLVQITNISPEWSLGWELRAEAAMRIGNHIEALHYARKALELDPQSMPARNTLGIAALRDQDAEVALEHFAGAMHVEPTASVPRRNIAVAVESRLRYQMMAVRCIAFVLVLVLALLWLAIHPPPLTTLTLFFISGYLVAAVVRALVARTLPSSIRHTIDIEPPLRHRYARWVTGMTIVGIVTEVCTATLSVSYLPVPPKTYNTLTGILVTAGLVALIVSNVSRSPWDALIARPFLALAARKR